MCVFRVGEGSEVSCSPVSAFSRTAVNHRPTLKAGGPQTLLKSCSSATSSHREESNQQLSASLERNYIFQGQSLAHVRAESRQQS